MIRVAQINPASGGFGEFDLGEWINPTSPEENTFEASYEYMDYIRELHGGSCEIFEESDNDLPEEVQEGFADRRGSTHNLGNRPMVAFRLDEDDVWGYEALDIS